MNWFPELTLHIHRMGHFLRDDKITRCKLPQVPVSPTVVGSERVSCLYRIGRIHQVSSCVWIGGAAITGLSAPVPYRLFEQICLRSRRSRVYGMTSNAWVAGERTIGN